MINLIADAHGGTPVIQPLIDFFHWILIHIHDVIGSWGWSIIALTVLVRACLLPLTFKQFHSMQRLAHLQPEMKKLQERFKNDKERMNQEMMKFYRENKVNPFASCLPMVAQFPVFISLYYMLRTDLRRDICPQLNGPGTPNFDSPIPCGPTGDSSFFFINDLTDKATGSTLIILIVLYVGSQLVSTFMSTVSADKTQRYLMYGLPFFFVTFIFQFPAGLLLYWITTNLWTIVQQVIVRRRLGPLRPPPDPDAPPEEKGPGFLEQLGIGQSREPSPAGATAGPKGRPTGPPPAPPRKKKKRSGRRR